MSMPKDPAEALKVRLKIAAPVSYLSRGALVEAELGKEHGLTVKEMGADRVWEIGRVVNVSEDSKEVGVDVGSATVDVKADKVRPLGGTSAKLSLIHI